MKYSGICPKPFATETLFSAETPGCAFPSGRKAVSDAKPRTGSRAVRSAEQFGRVTAEINTETRATLEVVRELDRTR
jgi:hypothetical protein